MTSEVVIANKSAIVMAADSALTIGKNNKIFTTSNKIFMLKKPHPIGIMIFGNSELISTPWEIIIKVYREEQRDEPWPNVEEYVKKFKKWIIKQTRFFPESMQRENIGIECYIVIEEEILEKIDYEMKKIEEINEKTDINIEEKLYEITDKIIDELNEDYKKSDFLQNFNDNNVQEFIKLYNDDLDEAISEFKNRITLNDKQKYKIKEITINNFLKKDFETYLTSGIIIAGYGNDDLFPSIYEFHIRGALDNKLIIEDIDERKISHEKPIFIDSYAQDDMIQAFIGGVHPYYDIWIKDYIMKLIDETHEKTEKLISPILKNGDYKKIKSKLEKLKENQIEQFTEKHKDTIKSLFTPIISLLDSLPKEELAIMAESLINIQSFKKRVSFDSETVGGPIDVAIITKGEGFIWIKRKHYFKPELNPDYMDKIKK